MSKKKSYMTVGELTYYNDCAKKFRIREFSTSMIERSTRREPVLQARKVKECGVRKKSKS